MLFDRGFIAGISKEYRSRFVGFRGSKLFFKEVLYPNIANAIIYKNNLQKSKIFRNFAAEMIS